MPYTKPSKHHANMYVTTIEHTPASWAEFNAKQDIERRKVAQAILDENTPKPDTNTLTQIVDVGTKAVDAVGNATYNIIKRDGTTEAIHKVKP